MQEELRRKAILFLVFASLFSLVFIKPRNSFALQDIFIKFIGPTIHPEGGNFPELYPIKFDRKGYLVLNVGGVLGADFFFFKDVFSVRVAQAFYLDCAGVPAGFSHIGLRGRIFKVKRHSLYGGLGPTLIFREDWNKFPVYKDDGYFRRYKGIQWKFIIYGGEFEYNYQVKDNLDLSITAIPGYPIIFTFAIGIKYWRK